MIKLNYLKPIDAEPLFNIVDKNRIRLQEWFPWVAKTNQVKDSLEFITSSDQNWGIYYNNTLVGVIGIATTGKFHSDEMCELGFWIDNDYEGKGIMKKACAALMEDIFMNSTTRYIIIKTNSDNQRCIDLLTSMEFELLENDVSSEIPYGIHCGTWLDKTYNQYKSLIPTIDPDVMIRKAEPVAYNKRLSKIYNLNEEGYEILKLANAGEKTIEEIANLLNSDEIDGVEGKLFTYKVAKFIRYCCQIELARI